MFIAEFAIGMTFTLMPSNLVALARRSGTGPAYTEVPRVVGQVARYYRLDHLKQWLDANHHVYRLDHTNWSVHVREMRVTESDDRHGDGTSMTAPFSGGPLDR